MRMGSANIAIRPGPVKGPMCPVKGPYIRCSRAPTSGAVGPLHQRPASGGPRGPLGIGLANALTLAVHPQEGTVARAI